MDHLEAKTTKILSIFFSGATILFLVSIWKGRNDGLIVSGTLFLIYLIARILVFYSKPGLVITRTEIRVKKIRGYKIYRINDYQELKINGDQRYSVLVGYKERDGKIKEENILIDIFDTPLYEILEFIHIQVKRNNALSEPAQASELAEFSKRIDNHQNKKYEKDFLLGILFCIIIIPGSSIGMYFQNTMTLVTLIVVIVFSCIWGGASYYLIIHKKMYLKFRRLGNALLPIIYLVTIFALIFLFHF